MQFNRHSRFLPFYSLYGEKREILDERKRGDGDEARKERRSAIYNTEIEIVRALASAFCRALSAPAENIAGTIEFTLSDGAIAPLCVVTGD